ncbi:hypothetical protein [Nostoc sp.]|uniref:hypothetical protein n=1 Tax=Nostoc sp. TaxID=1180 RepID=UPI002FF4AE76
MYCKSEDGTAVITWQYPEDPPKNFTSNITPIDVVISHESVDNLGIWSMITSDDFTANYPVSYRGTDLESPIVNGRTITTANTNRLISSDSNMSAGNVQLRNIVFTPNTQLGYRIKILDPTGKILFQDFKVSTVPPTYFVACGNACPNGYCKIDCEVYPGYCCINEAEIKSLSNQLNS